MNKSEFISTLESQLIRLPKSDRDDILSDYESHFAAGLENGLSEDEVCTQLGDPGELAKTYLENFPENAKGEPFTAPQPEAEATAQAQPVFTAGQNAPQYSGAYDYSKNAQNQSYQQQAPAQAGKKDNTVLIVLLVLAAVFLGAPAVGVITGIFFGLGGGGIGCICALFGCLVGGAVLIPASVTLGIGVMLIGIALGALGGLLIIGDIAFVKLMIKLITLLVDWLKNEFNGGNN